MITIRRRSKAAIITVHHMVWKNPPEKEMKYDKQCIEDFHSKIWSLSNHDNDANKDVTNLHIFKY